MELTDAAFVAKARSGDADAYRVLVERHSRALFRLAFRMTGNESDAEDVVQESFMRAYRQLGKFDERATFGTWLYRIATNCSLDLVRSRKRRSEQMAAAETEVDGVPHDPLLNLPASGPNPERSALSTEVRERVAEAVIADENVGFDGWSIGVNFACSVPYLLTPPRYYSKASSRHLLSGHDMCGVAIECFGSFHQGFRQRRMRMHG